MSILQHSERDSISTDKVDQRITECNKALEIQDGQDSPEIVLMEYEPSPPEPTTATGIPLLDFVNEALDRMCFGEEARPPQPENRRERLLTAYVPDHDEEVVCCGTSSFLDRVKRFLGIQAVEPLPPLPERHIQVWNGPCSFLSQGLLQLLGEDQAETWLPYLHFHRGLPAYPLRATRI